MSSNPQIIKSVKTQVNSFKSSSFLKTISLNSLAIREAIVRSVSGDVFVLSIFWLRLQQEAG